MVNRILAGLDQLMCPNCYLCQQRINSHNGRFGFCVNCLDLLQRPRWSCQRCGIALATQAETCGKCLSKPPLFERCYCAWSYREPVQSLVKQLKYQAQWQLGRQLSRVFAWQQYQILSSLPVDAVIAVPMFYRRQQQRGANHANVIARQLAFEFNWRFYPRAISRPKATKALHELDAKQRQAELKHAFRLEKLPTAKRIAIVDDVVTSAATTNEISRLVKQAGCKEVFVLALCRTQFERD